MTYNPITWRLASETAAATQIRLSSSGELEHQLPQATLYRMLWAYYLNNGLYDELRLLGTYTRDIRILSLRNPAYRVVEFYAATVWPGPLRSGLPVEGSPAVLERISRIWRWSNWAQKRQVQVRTAAIAGDAYLKVNQAGTEQDPRVYISVVDPIHVTEREADERGYITRLRVDVPQDTAASGVPIWHTEIWDRETVRVWRTSRGPEEPEEALGTADQETALDTWGIDFVPVVQARHLDIGGDYGLGAYTLQLEKIQEADLLATRLHRVLFRHNGVTWALQANAMDATGRPLPPPKIGAGTPGGASEETVDLAGEKMLRLPGMSTITPLVPQIDYSAHLEALAAMMGTLREELPELGFYSLNELPELSGRALRIVLSPAIARGLEVRGNHEEALIRAQQMAITIGENIGAFKDLPAVGTFADGALEHTIADRNLIPLSRTDIAELAQAETAAGIPVASSLRRSGWTEEELEGLEEDIRAEQVTRNTGIAQAALAAVRQSGGGETAQSNGAAIG